MTAPAGAIGDTATRVLLAVIQQKRPTVRSVALHAGRSINATHEQLKTLRAEGLVTWEDGKAATLRALVLPVRTGVRYDGAQSKRPRAALVTLTRGLGQTHLVGGGRLEADSIPPALVPHEWGHA